MTGISGLAAVAVAGLAAGTINTVVGSGTLITFPVLLSLGVPPVTANVSNTIGLVPGGVSGAWGYRRELAGQQDRLRRLGAASFIGGLIGASLLLVLPPGVFKAVVPVLIVLALVLVIAQPRLSQRFIVAGQPSAGQHPRVLWVLVLFTGVYGGYFGAAQGVLLLAAMGALLDSNLQRVNGLKNVLALLVNLVAGLLFIVFAHPNWVFVAIIAVSSAIGGQLGAVVGRRLPSTVLRAVIVLVGLAALVKFLFFS
ncbi:MAG: sulfite exporter TauE/SafE family protein [Actinomycetota bacterium]|nr:sulfite exporter TauE/SafE family protein [Actinomycetota bacterium]MDQ2956782.1 sulfite exporter TauE/SafE family protein [Actinomycetota bacterium]